MDAVSKKSSTKWWVFALLVVGACGLLLGTSEAVGTADETETRWLLTEAAVARTAAGDCQQSSTGTVCREECLVNVATGHEAPTGRFECFPF